MYKRKYGRMTVHAWLASEFERSNCLLAVFCGVVLVVAAIWVRAGVGSPYRTILELEIAQITPPVWLMTLLWTVAFFVNGCACGFHVSYRLGGCEAEKYKGCLWFLLLSIAELLWYPALFSKQLLFLCCLLSILILCLSVAVTASFYRVSKFSGMLLFLHTVWIIYMLILSFAVLIRA